MSLPIVDLNGDEFEQGLAHGQALASEVVHNIAVYFDRFAREAMLPREELLERSKRYLAALDGVCDDYIHGMKGLAEGSGLPFDEIVMLNLRYELLYFQYALKETPGFGGGPAPETGHSGMGNPGTAHPGTDDHGKDANSSTKKDEPRGPVDGCTAFALLPEAMESGHLSIGQNWDWIPQVKGALLRIEEPDGMRILSFTEAGILGGKIGMNSAGIGLGINGIISGDDNWTRFARPFHVRCFDILRSRDFSSAVKVVTGEPSSCSTNYLIAGRPDAVMNLEAAPDTVVRLDCDGGCLVHANHFRNPDAAGISEPPAKGLPHSRHRAGRLETLLREGQPLGLAALQDCLRDHDGHPNSVCRHEDEDLPEIERLLTLTSIIMDLEDGVMWVTDGPPCAAEYRRITL